MYNKREFNVTHAVDTLAPLVGNFPYVEGSTTEEVNNTLEQVIFALNINADSAQPIITRALYDENNDGVLTKAKFTFKPSSRDALAVNGVHAELLLPAGENFYSRFIEHYAAWQDKYEYFRRLQVNVDALNEVVRDIVAEQGLPFDLEFAVGPELIDATDSAAIVGLSEETVRTLSTLALFDGSWAERQAAYRERFVELLTSVTRPFEIVKQKTQITADLGIYSRRGLHKLIRAFVSRKLEFTRIGEGYVDTDSYFAVVQKVAATPEEIEAYEEGTFVVLENDNANVREKEAGKTKILVSYRVAPFDKETGEPVDVALEDILKGAEAQVA